MTERDPEILNEDEAARVWHRAAHLQAEAARKAEALAEDGAREEEDVSPIEGYAISQVRSAALSVGIGDEFVDAALADLRTERDGAWHARCSGTPRTRSPCGGSSRRRRQRLFPPCRWCFRGHPTA